MASYFLKFGSVKTEPHCPHMELLPSSRALHHSMTTWQWVLTRLPRAFLWLLLRNMPKLFKSQNWNTQNSTKNELSKPSLQPHNEGVFLSLSKLVARGSTRDEQDGYAPLKKSWLFLSYVPLREKKLRWSGIIFHSCFSYACPPLYLLANHKAFSHCRYHQLLQHKSITVCRPALIKSMKMILLSISYTRYGP